MALWHGYKQYAVDLAAKVRNCLGVSLHDRLDVRQLAAYYNLPIVSFEQLVDAPEAVQHYTETRWMQLSGYVLPVDRQQVILINPAHFIERIVSTIAHEVAHVILCHEPQVRLTGEKDCLTGDRDQEEEANWLGGELLVPREAARRLVFQRIDEFRGGRYVWGQRRDDALANEHLRGAADAATIPVAVVSVPSKRSSPNLLST